MADERDPIAAMNNSAGGKQDEKTGAKNANYTDAFDVPDQQGVIGGGKEPQHRAPPGEGVRAPLAQHTGGDPQFSVFDGKGNEKVVVATADEEGKLGQGTGDTAAQARREAKRGGADPGSGFGQPEKD